MNLPDFKAGVSLYESSASYYNVARNHSKSLVLPQVAAGDILGTAWCYGGCFW